MASTGTHRSRPPRSAALVRTPRRASDASPTTGRGTPNDLCGAANARHEAAGNRSVFGGGAALPLRVGADHSPIAFVRSGQVRTTCSSAARSRWFSFAAIQNIRPNQVIARSTTATESAGAAPSVGGILVRWDTKTPCSTGCERSVADSQRADRPLSVPVGTSRGCHSDTWMEMFSATFSWRRDRRR